MEFRCDRAAAYCTLCAVVAPTPVWAADWLPSTSEIEPVGHRFDACHLQLDGAVYDSVRYVTVVRLIFTTCDGTPQGTTPFHHSKVGPNASGVPCIGFSSVSLGVQQYFNDTNVVGTLCRR